MTDATKLRQDLEAALADVRLLTHEFYQRWEKGELSAAELREYAEQYRHFEANLPVVLEDILADLPAGEAADLIGQNLADETGDPTHLELFGGFLTASGGNAEAEASTAISRLVETYKEVGAKGPASAIAGLLAYELQAPEIAKSKGDGLRTNYGYDVAGTEFWDVHATLDIEHADWAIEALARVTSEEQVEEVVSDARRVADAWWAFLDERSARTEALS